MRHVLTAPDLLDAPERLARASLAVTPKGRRRLVALAGPPASGKSTLAEAVVAQLNAAGARAVLVPMDGFHLDNRILEPRDLLARKGAPETFDATGFVKMVQALTDEEEVVFPLFDRNLDCAVAGAGVITPDHDTVVVEGNYLLLDRDPWRALAPLWDQTAFLSVPLIELKRRLVARWLHYGLSQAAAEARAESNDLANAKTVLDQSVREAAIIIEQPAQAR